MMLHTIPSYCGGMFLTGFYHNTAVTDKFLFNHHPVTAASHYHGYCPSDESWFRLTLMKLLGGSHVFSILNSNQTWNPTLGTLIGVTNRVQDPSNLEKCGFVASKEYTKHWAYDPKSANGQCRIWIGDLSVVWPILVKAYQEDKKLLVSDKPIEIPKRKFSDTPMGTNTAQRF